MIEYKYILFDLDGTLSESASGIRWSLEQSLIKLGAPLPDLDNYRAYIGPPLIDTFKNLCGLDEKTAEQGVNYYRELYNSKGKYINKVYNGIPKLLGYLKKQGCRLAVCTSKFERFAEEITDYLKLDAFFDAVCGSTLDASRKDKKDLIPYSLLALGGNPEADKNKTVMIGDTRFDAIGALNAGVDFYGAAYGYGSVDEMLKSGAKGIALEPTDFIDLLSV